MAMMFERRKQLLIQWLNENRNDIHAMYSKHLEDVLSSTNGDEIEATRNLTLQDFSEFLAEGKISHAISLSIDYVD